jgi:ribonuclease J
MYPFCHLGITLSGINALFHIKNPFSVQPYLFSITVSRAYPHSGIPGGYVFVDGRSIGDVNHGVMRERERLSQNGIFLIDLSIDKYSGRILHTPEIITRGFVSPEEAERLIPLAQKKVVDIVHGGLDDERTIINAIRSFLYNETKRRPMVFVTLSKA